jgi:hypothetical protein
MPHSATVVKVAPQYMVAVALVPMLVVARQSLRVMMPQAMAAVAVVLLQTQEVPVVLRAEQELAES